MAGQHPGSHGENRQTAGVNLFCFSGRLEVVVNLEQQVHLYDDAVIFERQPKRVFH
jgi:hypothetical protein